MDALRQRATGRINVTSYDSKPYDDAGAFTIAEANILEEFSGDLVGIGSVRLITVSEAEGTAHFTGMERFLGKLGDRSGSFILQNSGTLRDGVLHSAWLVIAGSATGDLDGLRGEGGCDPNGYSLQYWFESAHPKPAATPLLRFEQLIQDFCPASRWEGVRASRVQDRQRRKLTACVCARDQSTPIHFAETRYRFGKH